MATILVEEKQPEAHEQFYNYLEDDRESLTDDIKQVCVKSEERMLAQIELASEIVDIWKDQGIEVVAFDMDQVISELFEKLFYSIL